MVSGNTAICQGRVVLLNRDLMLGIAITNTAKALGYTVDLVQTTTLFIDRLTAATEPLALAIVDMNLDVDWEALAALLSSGTPLPPLLGFGPHVDIEGRRAAKQAGLTRIVSNGEFHRDMATLIERYVLAPAPGSIANHGDGQEGLD